MSQLKYFNPATQQWELALVGAQGEQGIQGPTGPEGPVGKYYVSELEPSAVESGDAWFETATGKFYIYYDGQWVENSSSQVGPMGPTGPQGVSLNVKGETLFSGLPNTGNLLNDCYYVTDQNKFYSWNGSAWVVTATLPIGPTGALGPSNTLSIGTVVNGGVASATLTGTSPNQILNLVLPQGPTGADGLNGTSGVISVTAPILNSGTSTDAQLSLDSSVVLTSNAQTLVSKTFGFSFDAGVVVTTSSTPATIQFTTNYSAVQYWTSPLTQNFTLDFCVDPLYMQSFDSRMLVGDTMSIIAMFTNGSTAYRPTAFKIDNVSVTPKWLGGTAPTGGNTNAIDMYTFNIIKTASNAFTVLASQSKFV